MEGGGGAGRRMDELMQHAAQLLVQAQHAVALTGAGLSTPSGIPDFRSRETGLWENYDPMEIATFQAFRRRPADFFNWIRPLARQMFEAQPNLAHYALAQLQQAGQVQHIITQNIDGLQQRAGGQRVIELHGDIFTGTCVDCYTVYHSADFHDQFIAAGRIPTCPRCDGIIKPNVILFGEALPVQALMAAKRAVARCDVLLIAGSSLEVAPASDLPMLARARQARLIIVNQGPTYLDDYCDVLIREDVALALPAIATQCLSDRAADRSSLL
jgi:NAD-dependent deacetylase